MATKAELMGLPDELAERLYTRWVEITEGRHREGIGAYDGTVFSSGEAILLVAKLPEAALKELCFGPMPEPHCTVCRAMDRDRYQDHTVVRGVLDWHDQPYRSGQYRWRAGRRSYFRCLKLYEAAQAT